MLTPKQLIFLAPLDKYLQERLLEALPQLSPTEVDTLVAICWSVLDLDFFIKHTYRKRSPKSIIYEYESGLVAGEYSSDVHQSLKDHFQIEGQKTLFSLGDVLSIMLEAKWKASRLFPKKKETPKSERKETPKTSEEETKGKEELLRKTVVSMRKELIAVINQYLSSQITEWECEREFRVTLTSGAEFNPYSWLCGNSGNTFVTQIFEDTSGMSEEVKESYLSFYHAVKRELCSRYR